MKKFFACVCMLSFFLGFVPEKVSASDGYFIVTAYYSPLPNQKYYLRGNYEAEKTLNGQWIAGASGKKVFSWMLAAPGKYSFGTKIYLEGVWVWVVEDRWGAIVSAWKRWYEHDRIDIWVGYGDEWLRRALYWGKRKVKGTVVSRGSAVTLDYGKIPSPHWATNGLKKVSNVFHTPLWKGSAKSQVQQLQKLLQEVGLYYGEIDGIYNSEVIDIVYNFQIQNNIMKDESSYGAWYWGATTRNLFFKKYVSGDFAREKTPEQKLKEKMSIFNGPLKDSSSIEHLSDILTELALYEWESVKDYSLLKETILNYQLEKQIVPDEESLWAWVFGPKTRAALKSDYELYEQEKQRQMELEKIYDQHEKEATKQASSIQESIGDPEYGDITTGVRELQKNLAKLWYFDYKDTAIFWVKTQNSIIAFQIDQELIHTPEDVWAGRFGPKTREAFEEELKNIILQERLVEAWVFEEIETLKNPENTTQEDAWDISALEAQQIYTL